jgi:hypothetical protein
MSILQCVRVGTFLLLAALFFPGAAGPVLADRHGGDRDRERDDRNQDGPNNNGRIDLNGVLTAIVPAGGVSVKTAVGVITVSVAVATRLDRNNRQVTLAGLKVGDKIRLQANGAGVASRITATGP